MHCILPRGAFARSCLVVAGAGCSAVIEDLGNAMGVAGLSAIYAMHVLMCGEGTSDLLPKLRLRPNEPLAPIHILGLLNESFR